MVELFSNTFLKVSEIFLRLRAVNNFFYVKFTLKLFWKKQKEKLFLGNFYRLKSNLVLRYTEKNKNKKYVKKVSEVSKQALRGTSRGKMFIKSHIQGDWKKYLQIQAFAKKHCYGCICTLLHTHTRTLTKLYIKEKLWTNLCMKNYVHAFTENKNSRPKHTNLVKIKKICTHTTNYLST